MCSCARSSVKHVCLWQGLHPRGEDCGLSEPAVFSKGNIGQPRQAHKISVREGVTSAMEYPPMPVGGLLNLVNGWLVSDHIETATRRNWWLLQLLCW